jgi:mevalonate kinase
MRGVYCVDVVIKAVPIKKNTRLLTINKKIDDIPLAMDEKMNPLNERFISYAIKKDDLNKYIIKYDIFPKKLLSKYINSVMAEINELTDCIYESLVDSDYEEMKLNIKNLIKVLKDLNHSHETIQNESY